MEIRVRKVKKDFMVGNIDIDGTIYSDILLDHYSFDELSSNGWMTDDIIYSDGFISAIERGQIPDLRMYDTDSHRFASELEEYHHAIVDGVCRNIYFYPEEN
jgi:hypothetical protein